VPEKTSKTIQIKWVRSGIGFTYRQKAIVRSLGLNKLNHIVVRPDTPQIRGIVAAVPHMLEIVPKRPAPAWASIPEYTVRAPEPAPAAPAETITPAETHGAAEEIQATETVEASAVPAETAKPKAKSAKAGRKKKSLPEGSEPA
jgi:large subunit ribosomal protein L30